MAETPHAGAPIQETPVASPPTPEPQTHVPSLDDMTPTERDVFWAKGDLPTRDGAPPSSAEIDTATPVDRAASHPDAEEKPAASEPAAPATAKPTKKPKNADTRVEELLADRKQAREDADYWRQRAERAERGGEAPTHGKPASESRPKTYDGTDPTDPKPDQNAFENYEEYLDARDGWQDRRRARLADFGRRVEQQQRARVAHVEQFEQIAGAAIARVNAYKDKNPDFDIDADLLNAKMVMQLRPNEPVRAINVLVEEIIKSEHTGELFAYFSTPEGRERRAELEKLGPRELLKAFDRIEARFDPARDAASTQTPSPKTVSTATEPMTTVGKRASMTSDPQAEALKAGDYARWEKLEDERVLKAGRR